MVVTELQVVSVRVEPYIEEALQSVTSRKMRSITNIAELPAMTYCHTQGYLLDDVFADALSNVNLSGGAKHV